MRPTIRHAFRAAAVFMLAACGGGEPTGTVTNGSILGSVTDNAGATVANVPVRLTGNAQAARTTNSGADGVYTFADLPPGTYTLAVTPPSGFTAGAAGTASVTVAGGAQANASAFVLSPDTCALARPDFGGPASAADRALFAYDASAPLDLTIKVDSTAAGVEYNSISYNSPDGGRVPGIMYRPVGRSGPRPGVVVMHASAPPGGPVNGIRIAQFEMRAFAQRGAVVIGIDAPYARRAGPPPPLTFTARDRSDQIQLMKDLQRAVDVLLAEGNVDPARIGASGFSFGGMVAVHFAGIERRLKAVAIAAGYGGSVTLSTSASNLPTMGNLTCAARTAWFRDMTPVEPIRYISGAAPAALLFQIGLLDTAVLPADAKAAFDAASSPREVIYYDTGHGLSPQANADRFAWMHTQIGIDP